MPNAARLAIRAEINGILARFTPLGRTIVLTNNLFDLAKHVRLAKKTEKEVLDDATPGRETKGRAKQWEKSGGQEQADKDFDDLIEPGSEKPLPNGKGRMGKLPDGTNVNVRSDSSDGRPTVEIQHPNPVKIRYGN